MNETELNSIMKKAWEYKPVLRVSYSLLSLWEKGLYNDAIQMYLGLPRVETDAMREGKKWHKEWEEETKLTGDIPALFGGKLGKPLSITRNICNNVKFEQKIEPWLTLVGIPDMVEITPERITIHEYKTGVIRSGSYTQTMQVPIYNLLVPSHLSVVHHYNQHTNEVDTSYRIMTPKTAQDALDWVISLSSDIHHYFTENGIFQQKVATEDTIDWHDTDELTVETDTESI